MKIIQIISEHKYIPRNKPVKKGYKRVEAVIDDEGFITTRHIDVPIERGVDK